MYYLTEISPLSVAALLTIHYFAIVRRMRNIIFYRKNYKKVAYFAEIL